MNGNGLPEHLHPLCVRSSALRLTVNVRVHQRHALTTGVPLFAFLSQEPVREAGGRKSKAGSVIVGGAKKGAASTEDDGDKITHAAVSTAIVQWDGSGIREFPDLVADIVSLWRAWLGDMGCCELWSLWAVVRAPSSLVPVFTISIPSSLLLLPPPPTRPWDR